MQDLRGALTMVTPISLARLDSQTRMTASSSQATFLEENGLPVSSKSACNPDIKRFSKGRIKMTSMSL